MDNTATETKPATLAEITEQLLALCWQADSEMGELTPELEAAMDATESDLSDKVDRILGVVGDYEAKAAAYSERTKVLGARAKRLKANAAWLKGYVLRCMEAIGIAKLDTANFPGVSVRQNPPSVVISDLMGFMLWAEATIDGEDFQRQKAPEPNKTAIKDALKGGAEIPGCTLERTKKLVF